MIHREKILRKIHYEYYIMNFLWEYFLILIVVLSICYLHREHHWWIAYAKLNPPEGLCIFGMIWSMYCYDCQFMSLWFVFLFVAILVTLFLELLMYIENIIDGLLTRSWIRPKAFVFLAYDQFIVMTANDQFIVMINLLLLSLWFVFLSVAILVTLFLELLMKVMYAVKRLKLLHLIIFVFINFTRLQLCCFARV